jgi:hypothetical protein
LPANFAGLSLAMKVARPSTRARPSLKSKASDLSGIHETDETSLKNVASNEYVVPYN